MADFRRTIAEIQEIDPGSDTFRYTVNKQGNASVQRNFQFSLFEFVARLSPLVSALSRFVLSAADARHDAERALLAKRESELR
jgi:hypothetical protein